MHHKLSYGFCIWALNLSSLADLFHDSRSINLDFIHEACKKCFGDNQSYDIIISLF